MSVKTKINKLVEEAQPINSLSPKEFIDKAHEKYMSDQNLTDKVSYYTPDVSKKLSDKSLVTSGPTTTPYTNATAQINSPADDSILTRALDPLQSVFHDEKVAGIRNAFLRNHEGYEAGASINAIKDYNSKNIPIGENFDKGHFKLNRNISDEELKDFTASRMGIPPGMSTETTRSVGTHVSPEVIAREMALMNKTQSTYPDNVNMHSALDPMYDYRMKTGEYPFTSKLYGLNPADVNESNLPDLIKAIKQYQQNVPPSERYTPERYKEVVGSDFQPYSYHTNADHPLVDNSVSGFFGNAKDVISNKIDDWLN